MKNLIYLSAAFILFFAGTCGIDTDANPTPDPDPNQPHQNANIDVRWDWPDGTFVSTEQEIKIQLQAESTTWGMHVDFSGQSGGGYLALHSQGPGSQIGLAEFTIFGANGCETGDTGSSCNYTNGAGSSNSIELPYPITENYTYRLRIVKLEADNEGQWWGAWVLNNNASYEVYLGKLRKPNAATLAKNTYNYVDYTGGAVACDEVPASLCYFFPPLGIGAANTLTTATYSNYDMDNCVTGQVTVSNVDGVDGVPAVYHGEY